jgi:hypothetical protein
MNLLDALRDPRFLGAIPDFTDLGSWSRWLVFLKAIYGIPLDDAELPIFQEHTARSAPNPAGYSEAVAIVGRQSGKSRIAGTTAAYEAVLAPRSRNLYALLVAQDERGALRAVWQQAVEPFDVVPALAKKVDHRTRTTIELRNGVTLAAYPCRPAAIRGPRACVAIVDEIAHFTSTDGRPTDTEMLRAVRPTLATTQGKLIILSSPFAQFGALYDIYRRHFGRDDSTALVWQGSATEMNPLLGADYLARMREDPEASIAEVEGQFRAGLSSLFDSSALDACVVANRRELLPVPGLRYAAFCDPSGGRNDAFTLAVAHSVEGRVVVDCVRSWQRGAHQTPLNPIGICAEAAALLRTYRLTAIEGDDYAAQWVTATFQQQGVAFQRASLDKSRLYLALLPIVNAKAIELPDDPKLLRELRALVRRAGPSGHDKVDHPPREHDDRANSVAGVAARLAVVKRKYAGFGFNPGGSVATVGIRDLGGGVLLRSGERLIERSVYVYTTERRVPGGFEISRRCYGDEVKP